MLSLYTPFFMELKVLKFEKYVYVSAVDGHKNNLGVLHRKTYSGRINKATCT